MGLGALHYFLFRELNKGISFNQFNSFGDTCPTGSSQGVFKENYVLIEYDHSFRTL